MLGVLLLSGCTVKPITEETTEENPISLLEKEGLNSSYIQWYGRHTYLNEVEYFYHTATGFKIGTPASINASVDPQVDAIELDPFCDKTSETTLIV